MKRTRCFVIGIGRLGSNIAAKLSTDGEDVVVIDKSEDSFRKLPDSFSGYQVVGDVSDIDTLEKTGVGKAKTVVVTTDDDNVNLFIAEICYFIFNVPNVYIRLADNEKAKLISNTRIQAIYPFVLSMNEFIRIRSENEVAE
jgi:trk system potassium uptake protein